MFTFFQLLELYKINPSDIRLVRHGNKEISVLDTFNRDIKKFSEYTAWQLPGKFGNAKYLAIFSPARSTTLLFLGLWEIKGITKNVDLKPEHLSLLKTYNLPEKWFENSDRYTLEQSLKMSDLIQRLIIDWGYSTVSWVQKKDKNVVEIKSKNSIGDFVSYDRILLSYGDLKTLIHNMDSNASWINALSTVNDPYRQHRTVD
jgi:hypothetical protein